MTAKALLALLTPLALGAQRSERAALAPAATLAAPMVTRHREPVIAGVLGFFPGLGHVYAAEPKRGLAVLGVWFAGAFAALNSSNKLVSNTGGVLLLGSHVFSVVDAARAARRFNKRHAD